MATHFIGANYGGTNMAETFVKDGVIGIGFDDTEAFPIHRAFGNIMTGDSIVIKAYSPSNGLYIKAVGICTNSKLFHHPIYKSYKEVHWLWSGNECLGIFRDSYTNIRTGTIYNELNEEILRKVISLATGK